MCGIAGILHLDGAPAEVTMVQRMTDSIAHRGPDGEGIFTDGPVSLGHRRLAIIDLTPAGHQPMQTADGRFIISYNGEVYNFQELRVELEEKGCTFHSRTDSEVVLNAFAEWGTDALSRFNGMFAFAIWDTKERVLTLARDRYGIKPVYYARVGNTFLFGSEIKALLASGKLKAEMNLPGLLEYMTFQNFFTDQTLFSGAVLMPAGSFLKIRMDTPGVPEPERYWDYDFREPENPLSEGEYTEELVRLFQQAVSRQLVSDVPIGSYLSGGMDSGSITCIAAQQLEHMTTFTVGFELASASGLELNYDERGKAEHMSYLFGTEHYEMVLKAGDMERSMSNLVWHLEEPRVGQCYPNYYAARLAGKFNKVVLSGAGGDELFGGYPWRYYRAVINDSFDHYTDKYYQYWQRLIRNQDIQKAFSPVWDQVKDTWTKDIFSNVFTHHANELSGPTDYINHSLYFEASTFLHGLLVVDDKLSMAHGMETRVPFLDNDLVDFSMQVPVHMKLGNLDEIIRLDENEPGPKTKIFFENTNDGKLILRKAMGQLIPDEISNRTKQGFSAPDSSWFRGESIDYVRSVLFDNNAMIYDFVDRKVIQALLQEHLDGIQNRRLLVWSMLYLEEWCQLFLRNQHVPSSQSPQHGYPQA